MTKPRRDQLEPSLRHASIVVPLARRSRVSPAASSWLIVRRVTRVPLSTRSIRALVGPRLLDGSQLVPVSGRRAGLLDTHVQTNRVRRAGKRCNACPRLGVGTVLSTVTPCSARRRPRAGQPVVRDIRPVSAEPMTPFVQRLASESGFSFRRSKLSIVGSGRSGGTRPAGVAETSLERGCPRRRSQRTPCSSRSPRSSVPSRRTSSRCRRSRRTSLVPRLSRDTPCSW